jgi:signal transduction histidine kinase
MSHSEPHDIMLTAIKVHLSAAETALDGIELNDPSHARERALVELRAASTAHEEYTRSISHDLRNSLTLISGQVQLLQRMLTRESLSPARLRTALDRIEQSVMEANAIIRRFADLDS